MGLDTYLATAESLHEQMYGESRFRPHPILKQMVEAELLGKKSGKGFFTYKEK
jgi:3-hydroxybutyryl-CoA dehydrogenase